jgi:uncharacterized membrane protein YkvA (DUF1232 family)
MSGPDKVPPETGGFDAAAVLDPARALVPHVARLNERRVARGFWPKMRRVAAHIPFAGEALALWYCARDDETPLAAKGMILAALAYFVLPIDAIPDVIAGLGYTDDAAVVMAALTLVGRHLKPRHRAAARDAVERLRAAP